MRLFSNFRDYYDIGLQHGIDPNIIYLRETEEVVLKEQPPMTLSYAVTLESNHRATPIIIGFCGDIYPALEIYANGTYDYCYSISELTAFLVKHKQQYMTSLQISPSQKARASKAYDDFIKKLNNLPTRRHWFSTAAKLNNHFTNPHTEFNLLFDQYKAPIFYYNASKKTQRILTLNPQLAEVDFARIIDPYTAFTTLSMYMGNLGMNEPNIIEVSDETKRDKHGFNDSSFKRSRHQRKSK